MENKTNLHYKRLFVLQPTYYKKLAEAYDQRNQLNDFGREISDILFDKKLDDTQKYYSYVKNLSKRLSQFQPRVEKTEVVQKLPPEINLTDTLMKMEQSIPKVYASIETQVSPKKFRNKFVQTEQPEPSKLEQIEQVEPEEELFEYNPDEIQIEDKSIQNKSNSSNVSDYYLDEKLHEIAQKYSGETNMNNIVPDKISVDSKYKIFYNLKTEDQIAVEIQPIYDLLYNDKNQINWSVSEEKKPLKGRYIIISAEDNPVLKRTQKRKNSLTSESVLEKTLLDLAISSAPGDVSFDDMIVERESIDKDFRIFQDRKSGKKIAVEVAPVYENLLNKSDSLDLDVSSHNNYIILRSRKIKRKPTVVSSMYNARKKPIKKKKKRQSQSNKNNVSLYE